LQQHEKVGPGQESVRDYPRPPRLEVSRKHIQVIFNGIVIADSTRTKRMLETSHPPNYYIPPGDVRMEYLKPSARTTFCEWKGAASYYDVLVSGRRAENAAWCYRHPTPPYAGMKDYLAFYPGAMDECLVDGERVQPESGNFYGGWVTKDIVLR
jgi:uncharacterized protein (DUF427 family)